MSYAELICQSHYSFLQGASSPSELIAQAEQHHYFAIAITDECSVAGVVKAHRYIEDNDLSIKLIIGARFSFVHEDGDQAEFVLLCPNRHAYAELCRIITNSRRRCSKGHYRLTDWDINSLKYCFVLWLAKGEIAQDTRWLKRFKRYHDGRLWLAIYRELSSQEHVYLAQCQTLSQQYDVPIVCTNNALMSHSECLPLQHVLSAIYHGQTVAQLGKKLLCNGERSLRSLAKIRQLFAPQYIEESLRIAQRCQFSLSELKYQYPAELIPKNQTPMAYLKQLVVKGKALRFPQGVPHDIEQLIAKELCLIEKMHYEHFFITIYDIVQFAKRQGILYQGRGSAANSVVCYCLEITAVDPRQISVLFERFISQERQEPPDIDVDFEHQRREEVFQYIYQKYGRERTALAASVVTYRLKSAIREVGKALGFNLTQLEFFIKNINRRDKDAPWYSQLTELGLDIQAEKAQQFIQLVEQIKGVPRHLSQHVGGFIISSGPLYELVPIENAAMQQRTVIQWDKDDLETLHLLKVDVLALGMLTAIRKTFDVIACHYQQNLSIAMITNFPDDPQVYQMIAQADTVGVFQIESRAQMTMLPRLKPKSYYDLVIQIAIVRPGPIQGGMVHPYLKRRNGEEAIDYPSEEVRSVLDRTMGVPIFQEQVIKLAMVAAGFSGGEADKLRRAMGKWKKNGEINRFREQLINGMQARGYDLAFAERIFAQILGFGEYGFPESHSASFAVLAYVSAWLKYYYPEAFYCSLLNSLPMGFYSPSQLIQDAQRHQIDIRPICINQSQWQHCLVKSVNGLALQLGFSLIKGVSELSCQKLIAQRPDGGYQNFAQIHQLALRENELQALASANCFEKLATNRYQARWQLMNSHNALALVINQSARQSTQIMEQYPLLPNDYDNLLEDYAATGLSLTQHPIALLKAAGIATACLPACQLSKARHKSVVSVVGVVTGRQSPGTASGVTFMTLEDETGNINVVVWLATARAQKQRFLSAKILQVQGIIEREHNVIHVIAGRLTDLSEHYQALSCSSRDFH